MKKMFFLCAFINTCLYAQVGINKEAANATLDIQSNNNSSETKSIKLSNQSNKEVFYISDNGQFYFNSAFKPNGNPGEKGQYLVSKGPEKSPEWEYIIPDGTRYIYDIFNIYFQSKNNTTSSVLNRWVKNTKLSEVTLSLDENFASWGNNEITIKKSGLFQLTVNTQIFTSTRISENLISRINLNNKNFFQINSVVIERPFEPTTYYYNFMNEDIILPLKVDDKIFFEFYSDIPWSVDFTSFHLKYINYE